MLAAAPATAVQLTHACVAAGFGAVIPASWGDELIAARVLDRLREADGPVVQCSCPVVARRLAPHGDALAPMTLCLVPPPVATANYLRALYAPATPRITYAGGCPGARNDVIDEWLTPEQLFQLLAASGVPLTAQPREFDAVLAPDRRRFHSDPGGMPVISALREAGVTTHYVEGEGERFTATLAECLLGAERALVDVAGPLGCVCSGVRVPGQSSRSARARVLEHEPPRAPGPVLDDTVRVSLDAALPAEAAATRATPVTAGGSQGTVSEDDVAITNPPATEPPRRRSPAGTRKSILGGMPHARTDVGRQLPRAYVARRRSSPKGTRTQQQTSRAAELLARRWPYIAAAGMGVGLVLAWLVGLIR